MTPAERTLLLALFRWARSGPVAVTRISDLTWYAAADGTASVLFTHTSRRIKVRRGMEADLMRFTSISEAVDVLVALGIVPARFSTAYRAGWNASCESEHLFSGDEWRAIVPAVPS